MPLSAKDKYEFICRQIERETTLHQSRTNFLIIINSALATVVAAHLSLESGIFVIPVISLFALAITWALGSLMRHSRLQHRYLEELYYGLNDDQFPRPFFSATNKPARAPKILGRLVREFIFGWAILLAGSIFFLVNHFLKVV